MSEIPGGGREDGWQEVDGLFKACLELAPANRDAYLVEACGEDDALRRKLERLLAAAEGTDRFLDPVRRAIGSSVGPALEQAGHFDDSPGSEAGGGRGRLPVMEDPAGVLGPYRLLEVLGRGGMATVYLAERTDGVFQRRVAIKILRYAAGEELERRFLGERQILAGFQHPNIAGLLDGGTTADHRPYLVLEYVQGEALTSYCDRRELPLRSRLELFLTVCRAVQHAHQHLIVHRDLKPSNVLVTEDGQVKLLDFGIAKLLADLPSPDVPVPHTRTDHLLLTPEYASPEQFRGDPVSAASDVYQLGVLLYELVTGCRPFAGAGQTMADLGRAVCEEEPDPPGEVADGMVPGDLEQVILMALRKEPDRRYSSADALASDLERFLGGRPVRARPDRWTYRMRRFVARNRWPLTAAALASLALIGFGVVQQSNARRLAAERDRAEQAAARAEEVRDFTLGLFQVADPGRSGGEDVTARELLEVGANRIRRDLADQPLLRAEMLSTMASIYLSIGLRERASRLAEEAYGIRGAMLPEAHPDRAESALQTAHLAARVGDSGATVAFRHALDAVRAAHGEASTELADAFHLAAMRAPGLSLEERWAMDDSALAILEASGPGARAKLARVLVESLYHGSRGRAVDSTRLWRALELQRELEGARGPGVAAILADIGQWYEAREPDRAIVFTARALDMHRSAHGRHHPTSLTMANNLAGLYRDRGRPGDLDRAEELYREVLEARRRVTEDPAALAYTLYGLGRVLVEQGRGEQAEPYLREILAVDVFPERDLRHALVQVVLGRALLQQGRFSEAESALDAAAAGSRDHTDAERERLQARVALFEQWGRQTQARRAREALASLDTKS